MAKEKKIQKNSFELGVQSDPANDLLDPRVARFLLNCRVYEPGYKGQVKTVNGNTQLPFSLPSGNNFCLGWGSNEEKSKFYWFNWNSNAYHGIYCYDDTNQSITPVIQNLIDTNNVDIMKFDPSYLINHVDIIQDELIYWVDGLNKARKFNISKAIDQTSTGYGTIISEDFITAYKQTSPYAPLPTYFTDVSRLANYLYGLQFKFAQRFWYDDGEQSNVSDMSVVALAPNENYLGADNISNNNNGINVQVWTGNRLVTKVEVLVQMTDGTVILPWQTVVVLDKADLTIPDNSQYTYAFYNDAPLTATDNTKVVRPYSFLPRVPNCQSFTKLYMIYGNFFEGFPAVNVNASVAVTSKDLFLPSDTTTQLNSPAFTVTLTSKTLVHGGFLAHDNYWQTLTHFVIGHDVKKGNTFVLTGKNGADVRQRRLNPTYDNYLWSYTATAGDDALSIAARVKQWLRSTGRGIPDAGNGISNEVTDGSGNVSWDYDYLGHDNTQPTLWAGSVNPVNYSTLTNLGYSVNVIKSGCARKYAIIYYDDDGRISLAYTNDNMLAKTPFLTQWGTTALQQPIHTITISSQPPLWAKYWALVRTEDITDFTQMLIQSVNTINVVGEGTYLDLIVGSLNTYQLIHPNTVVKYQFQKGDRLRIIRNEVTGNLYTPYFETEVLSYLPVVEQLRNAQIVCTTGSANVTPADGPSTNNIGMFIVINNIQRTIVGVSGGDYVLDEPINPTMVYSGTPSSPATFPNYTLIDMRGTVRINIPDPSTGITIVPFSTVEIYHPQVSVLNEAGVDQAVNFQDFGFKFEVANAGTPQAAHRGNVQDQDGSNPTTTPCIVQVTQGDCYIRNRALPTNSPENAQDAQVLIDSVEDPNYSDFYVSNLYSLGRTFPQDTGVGSVNFNQRQRWSNPFIANTQTNGLADFDNQDRIDYNDKYGSHTLTRFKNNRLHIFKQFKNTETPVGQRIIIDNNGNETLATSDNLLNDLQYDAWEGGIGNDGASWFENGNYMYIASKNSGVFLRFAQNGWEPISSKFLYDAVARQFLGVAQQNNLQIQGQFDKLNDEAIWSYAPFIQYLYNGPFLPSQWQTLTAAYPVGTTWSITQQPANSTASIVGGIVNITGTNTLGDDYFLYQGNLPGGGTTPVLKFCFTVVNAPNRPTGWQVDGSTTYCVKPDGTNNNGQQGWAVLDQIYTDNGAATGLKMPNVYMIAPEAIVPVAATITFNANSNVSPSGGSNGDVWYNAPADALYAKIAGTWTQLFDRVINPNFVNTVLNTGSCPIPPPTNFYMLQGKYNMGFTGVSNGTCTGTPPSLGSINIPPNGSTNAAYTTITAGTVQVHVQGMPAIPGHIGLFLEVNGAVVSTTPLIGGSTSYNLDFTSVAPVNSPTPIIIGFYSF